MVSAEVLRLRRNRGLMALAFVLSSVMVVLVFAYIGIRYGQNPLENAPAGGSDGLRRGLKLLGLFMGTLIGALIGTEAGTADLSSGIFRDLVATGRSRLALFFVRLPGALLVTWAFTGAAYVLTIIGAFVLSGAPDPSLGTILLGAVWLAGANAVTVALAVGVGSVTGSRGLTLTAVIGFQTVVTQVLAGVPSLGSARDALVLPALSTRMPLGAPYDGIAMSAVTAVVILACWAVVPTLLGAWRTRVRDA